MGNKYIKTGFHTESRTEHQPAQSQVGIYFLMTKIKTRKPEVMGFIYSWAKGMISVGQISKSHWPIHKYELSPSPECIQKLSSHLLL